MIKGINAIIFDWGRTLFDSDAKKEFPESEKILQQCRERRYRLAVVSLVTAAANSTLKERIEKIESSPLRHYFEIALVTDTDKDVLFNQVVTHFVLPRSEILIVDDRTVRGIRYGTRNGHPTAWIQKGKFAGELPNKETGQPTYIVHSLGELLELLA